MANLPGGEMNRPLLVSLGVMAGGIIGGRLLALPPGGWLSLMILLLGIAASFWVRGRRQIGFLLISILFCGAAFGAAGQKGAYQQEIRGNAAFDQQRLTITGVQITDAVIRDGKTSLVVALPTDAPSGPRGRLLVYLAAPQAIPWYGRELQLTGRFVAVKPVNQLGPSYYEQQGLTGILFMSSKKAIKPGQPALPFPLLWSHQLRERLISQSRKYLTKENEALLQGVLFGLRPKPELLEDVLRQMQQTGMMHLLAVSGLHIGIVVGFLTLLLRPLQLPRRIRLLFLIGLTSLYILMTGLRPSVLRAGLMLLIYLWGKEGKGAADPLERLSLAGIVLLLFNPNYLFNVGYQLSMFATAGVVWLMPLLAAYLGVDSWPNRLLIFVFKAFLLSFSVQLLLIPLLIIYFGYFSWLSPLVNLFLAIPATLIVVGGLAGEFLALIIPSLGEALFWLVELNLTLVKRVTAFFAGLGWGVAFVDFFPWPWLLGYYLALVLFLDKFRPNLINGHRGFRLGSLFIGLLIIGNLLIWQAYFTGLAGAFVELTVLDVGQGDALVLQTPDGVTALIDTGKPGQGRKKIVPFLRKKGVKSIDLIILTHHHQDHYGGLAAISKKIPVRRVYTNQPGARSHKLRWKKSVLSKAIQSTNRAAGLSFKVGKHLQGTIWQAPGVSSENDRSLVTLMSFGRSRLLFTGDLSRPGERVLTALLGTKLRANLLKVGHHGSDSSTTLPFLSQVKPQLALISVGKYNHFGHPGPRALNRIRSVLGGNIYRTDQAGDLRVRIYGDKIRIWDEK